MTIQELHEHHFWLTLTDLERAYLEALINHGGDRPKAIKEVLKTPTDVPYKMQRAKMEKTFGVSFLASQICDDPVLTDEEIEHRLKVMLRDMKGSPRDWAALLKMYLEVRQQQPSKPKASADPLEDWMKEMDDKDKVPA